MKHVRGKKVFVGLSGGVDSAVTAAILKESGADVYGVFIKGWYPPELPCTWAADRRDAMKVAAHLRIPFHTLDASSEYKRSVIDYLVREYGAGRTPNPDIMCNRDVKFGAFFEFAKSHGADFIATGHYARQSNGELLRGTDIEKDQSYFLWAISSQALAHTLFPLGEMQKSDVRALAATYALPNAKKRDSQGICFLGPVSMDDFLRAELPYGPGNAYDEAGGLIGTHDGALLYTLGERIALTNASQGPWYVIEKRIQKNELVVSSVRKTEAHSASIRLTDTNWFAQPGPHEIVQAQFRYHGPLLEGTVQANAFIPVSPMSEPLASGQSLVIYRDGRVLGGGIIE